MAGNLEKTTICPCPSMGPNEVSAAMNSGCENLGGKFLKFTSMNHEPEAISFSYFFPEAEF
jgi:hypothetical protein